MTSGRKLTNLEQVKFYAEKYAKSRKKLLSEDRFFWQRLSSMQCSIRYISSYGMDYRTEVLLKETKRLLGVIEY